MLESDGSDGGAEDKGKGGDDMFNELFSDDVDGTDLRSGEDEVENNEEENEKEDEEKETRNEELSLIHI